MGPERMSSQTDGREENIFLGRGIAAYAGKLS